MMRRRAVFVSPIMPDRTGNGLAMRMGLFLEALARMASVELIVVPAAGGTSVAPGFYAELDVRLHVVACAGRRDTAFQMLARVTDPGRRLQLFQTYGKPSITSHLSAPVMAEIAGLIAACDPDIVHVGRSYLAPCIDVLGRGATATIDLDEDDAVAFGLRAVSARARHDEARAAWLEQEARAFDGLIERYVGRFGRVFVSSEQEARLLASRHAGLACDVIENAVALPAEPRRSDDGATLVFVGSLSHEPNVEGVLWFAREVMPHLRHQAGRACRLVVAGAEPPPPILALAAQDDVEVAGFVPDIAGLYRDAALALAPLLSGGGTRIKLLEASAHGVAFVSTPAGAAGLDWPQEAGGWIAESPQAFADCCAQALADSGERSRRAQLGRDWVRRHHDRQSLIERLGSLLVPGTP
ncbi:glycosyltransferase family 4 protein [Labrys sp. La1]|uniref:glycosyltransferase family 4 protein n=1 Tax=Labrys sp. La1 TaxID=3404917 RepID=UPI003EC054F9